MGTGYPGGQRAKARPNSEELVQKVLSSPRGEEPGRPFGGPETWTPGRTHGKDIKRGQLKDRGTELILASLVCKEHWAGSQYSWFQGHSVTTQL